MVSQMGEAFIVYNTKTKKNIYKRIIELTEAGKRRGDCVMVTALGDDAESPIFGEGDFILATVRLSTHEYNGQFYNDAILDDYLTLIKNNPN